MPERYKDKVISVIGLGYIGLPTAAVFASKRIKVIGLDINEKTVSIINKGKIHIQEPELDILVHSTVHEGYLRATLQPEPADAFLIAVPTPFKDNFEPDLSYIEAAARSIAPVLRKGNLVILESTSPIGTTEQMSEWLAQERPDLSFPHHKGEASDIRIAHCPERVLPGHILREIIQNTRIIGGITYKCAEAAAALYKVFVEGACLLTDTRTAEMCKLIENSYRDVNIAFANELSIICDKHKIDVHELIDLANYHPRVNILQPSCGVGGHCVAIDPWFIVHQNPKEAILIKTAREVNNFKPIWIINKVEEAVGRYLEAHRYKTINEIKIACFGLAFKPNIDDLRESPALQITLHLAEKYPNQVIAVEPNIDEETKILSKKGIRLVTVDYALKAAEIIVILVKHEEFLELDLSEIDWNYIVIS
ncbi:MAG TPA: UDP-N-acetyl-D-mannosamine dehydrogenase [Lentisphaeria bacterium]|nr:MAG: UDP-N-acetyl-D-mannosaminuronic acid dehydrogenase [Lentisphaerae bacterium GWF2_38_69]HBM16718.1 UDP-N-acetyl-D-mannosamine dehydrogenase [Lentisphaeria bacterium]